MKLLFKFSAITVLLLIGLRASWAQSAGAPAAAAGPLPAEEQTTAPSGPIIPTPPISGLDEPSILSEFAGRSLLRLGVHLSEGLDSNGAGNPKRSALRGVSRLTGDLDLERIASRYQTSLHYVGGVSNNTERNGRVQEVQSLDIKQRLPWRRGELDVSDSFRYLTEGSFGGGSFGGASSGAGGAEGGSGETFGSLGVQPRYSNVSSVEIREAISPKAAVNLGGTYTLIHYLDAPLIRSNRGSGQAGYTYQISRANSLGGSYIFSENRFPNSLHSRFQTNSFLAQYQHRFSGRLVLLAGGGPDFIKVNALGCTPAGCAFVPPNSCIPGPICKVVATNSTRITAAARADLDYILENESLKLSYRRSTNGGSGFFVGATSDVLRADAEKRISRVWRANVHVGESSHSSIANTASPLQARSYSFLFAGAGAERPLSRHFQLAFSYHFTDLSRNSLPGVVNPGAVRRNIGSVSLYWHPQAMRID